MWSEQSKEADSAILTGKSMSKGPVIAEPAAKVCIPASGSDVACEHWVVEGGIVGCYFDKTGIRVPDIISIKSKILL